MRPPERPTRARVPSAVMVPFPVKEVGENQNLGGAVSRLLRCRFRRPSRTRPRWIARSGGRRSSFAPKSEVTARYRQKGDTSPRSGGCRLPTGNLLIPGRSIRAPTRHFAKSRERDASGEDGAGAIGGDQAHRRRVRAAGIFTRRMRRDSERRRSCRRSRRRVRRGRPSRTNRRGRDVPRRIAGRASLPCGRRQ
jgi:hypothetical protein